MTGRKGRSSRTRHQRPTQRTAAPKESSKRFSGTLLIAAVALAAMTFIAYLPALQGDFLWDDDDYVSANPTLQSAQGLQSIWLDPAATPQYYPLVHTSYWLEYRLWGLAPTGYHVTNVVLHLAATLLLWRILLLLAVPGAWLVAAIFAVHPVHVESVAWITERKNVLSGVFYFSAMLAYLHFALDAPDAVSHQRRLRRYGTACALFGLALLSKTVTATLPAALLLVVAWKRGRLLWRDVWPLLPLFTVGVTMGLITAWLEKHHVGAQGIDWQLSVPQRIVIAGRALWFYAAKLVWPTNLTFIYPRWHIDATDPRQLAYPIAVAASIVGLWLARRKIGSGALVAVLLFAATLFPALGFVDTFPMRYSFVADHFQYLASIALIALAVGTGARVIHDWFPARVRAARAFGLVAVLMLAFLTWRQSHLYADQESLWTDTVRKDPASWMGHTSLGAVLGRRGDLRDAESHYREAVRLNPAFSIARTDLGGLLANQERFAEAIPHFRELVRLEPNSLEARISLGRALVLHGQPDEGVTWLRSAVEGWPGDAGARAFLDEALDVQRRQFSAGRESAALKK